MATASGTTANCQRRRRAGLRRPTVQAIPATAMASINKPTPREGIAGAGGSGRERGRAELAAVVVTVTVTFVGVLPAVTGFGETVHVASDGAPVQVKLTFPVSPPSPPTLSV